MPIVSHLLLVKDDPVLLCTLEAILECGGFRSDAAASAKEAMEYLGSRAYAAILLDLSLPDVDGVQLIGTIRAVSDIPILVVSGRADDKVSALDLGADDFIAKPFLPDELLARIRAVLRRQRSEAASLSFADSRDATDLQLSLDNIVAHHLRPGTLEAKLFAYLQDRADKIVSSEELVDLLWGENTERALNHLRVLVAKLRTKLEAEDDKFAIINEWGQGYRLTALKSTAHS